PAERRLRLTRAVVDVGADRVQRDAAFRIALDPAHLAAAEAAGALDLHAVGAGAHRRGERALHGAPEADPVLELLGDRLGDQLRGRVPVRLPVVDDAHAQAARMDLLPHYSSVFFLRGVRGLDFGFGSGFSAFGFASASGSTCAGASAVSVAGASAGLRSTRFG